MTTQVKPAAQAPVNATIALVDDDRNFLSSLSMALEAEGFVVKSWSDPEVALRDLSAKPADIAVVDIKMPRLDGLELLTRLRRSHAMPIIFLTSKDDEDDEIEGLRLGADDYIRKPASQKVLFERIRALLRRQQLAGDTAPGKNLIARGELVLDADRHLCTWQGKPVELTVTEFLLVKELAYRPGHVKNRDRLIDAAYGDSVYVDDRTIDSHIKRLRRKFKAVDDAFDQIETLYGVGYKFKG
jgi:two-component system, OmpR family, response regulator ChvI